MYEQNVCGDAVHAHIQDATSLGILYGFLHDCECYVIKGVRRIEGYQRWVIMLSKETHAQQRDIKGIREVGRMLIVITF